MGVVLSFPVSLALTLVLELGFARLWGVEREDRHLVVLVNVLTNPLVVLGYHLVAWQLPGLVSPVVFVLEAAAVVTEGWFYRSRSRVCFPWFFALCANLFSFCVGLLF